jgi:hypothetical protein
MHLTYDIELLERLTEALLDNAYDLKAESLLAHVIAAGYPREDFTIGTGKFFQRSYVNDLTGARLHKETWLRGQVHVQLSRPGFYDMLPEGLFFQPAGAEYNSTMGVTEMAALHRWNKTREDGIRNFFKPFEHAGFYQLLQLAEEERSLGMERTELQQFFRSFWELPASLDSRKAGYFILLIPHACRITGDLPLMQQCLELLLGEPVIITQQPPLAIRVDRELEKGLGQQALGEDTVCGNSFFEPYPSYKYSIGPLPAEQVAAYLPEGSQYTVIETFNRFFVPVEADTETQIEIDTTTLETKLEKGKEPLLGYSAVLI